MAFFIGLEMGFEPIRMQGSGGALLDSGLTESTHYNLPKAN